LNRVAVFFANYACLDVVPAHIVHSALTGIERRRSASAFRRDSKKLATYVTWRHIVGWVFLSRGGLLESKVVGGGKKLLGGVGLYRSGEWSRGNGLIWHGVCR